MQHSLILRVIVGSGTCSTNLFVAYIQLIVYNCVYSHLSIFHMIDTVTSSSLVSRRVFIKIGFVTCNEAVAFLSLE